MTLFQSLREIARAHFSEYLADDAGSRPFRLRRLFVFAIVPLLVGVLLSWKLGPPGSGHLTLIAAVYAVVTSVLVGLIPLAQSVIAQIAPNRLYQAGERRLADQEINRIQTLQGLHAAISYATILLVASLGACVLTVFLLPVVDIRGWKEVAYCTAAIIYTVGASTALTFLDVATGVFEVMENHADMLKWKVRSNVRSDADSRAEQ